MSQREEKLLQAQELLKTLGLPKSQYNNRSAWVFLALSNIKPDDSWNNAQAPLLPTVEIMQFIREHYGQDYKPNSRETIRRQTLHQFEQARIVDRNRDDPSRATNSKDNNYSLNSPIIEVLQTFPGGNWKQRIERYKANLQSLQELYQRSLEMHKIPVKLPSGQEVKLSPGKHNQLHADIIHEFCPRFIGEGGIVLYIGDTASSRKEGGKLMVLETEVLEELGVPPMSHDKLPDVRFWFCRNKYFFRI